MADSIEIVVKADGRQALANLEKLRLALADVDSKASTGRVQQEIQSLNRVWSVAHRELMSGMRLLGITGGLLGGGLVAGLVAGGKALADFSAQGLQLHYLAKELGTSAEALERWKLAGKAAGMASETAANDVETALRKIQELGRKERFSELYNDLVKSTADRTGAALADALMKEVQAGGPEQGFRFMLQKLAQYAKEGNQWGVTTIEKALGLHGKGWERGAELIEKIGKVTVVSVEDAQKLQLQFTLLGLQVDNFTTAIGNELMPVFTRMAETFNNWLGTEPGKEFQKSLVDAAKQLENLPWEDIQKGARSTVGGVISLFREGKKLIEADIEDYKRIMDTFDDLARRGDAAKDKMKKGGTQWLPDMDIWKGWQWGNILGGKGGLSQKPHDQPPNPNQVPMRFSGGGSGATDFSSVTRRAKTTEDLNDQMRDVTDEVRRLNDLLRGGGDVAQTPGGSAGGMGPTGGAYTASSSSPYSDSASPGSSGPAVPGSATPAGASSPYRPAATTAAMPGSSASLGYPAGAGGTGGFTPVQNLTQASGANPPGGGVDATGPYPGSASEAARGGALYQKLLAEFRANPPQGIPPDGARFGITKGTPEEWARFGVAVAKEESSFDPKTKNLGDAGGSFGVFQYSHQQVPGNNAYDVDASVKAFVRDSNQAAKNPGGFGNYGERGSSIMANRFNVIGIRPQRTIRSLPAANQIANQAGAPATAAVDPSKVSLLKTAQTSEIDLSGMLGPDRLSPQGLARAADGSSLVEQVQGQVAGTRKGGIDPRLDAAFQYAAEQAGLRVRVTSGGQRMQGAPGATGSHRHDQGKAADFDLVDPKTGAVVSRDDPRRLAFIEAASRAGAGGAGYGYMSDALKLHMGITGSGAKVGEGLGAYAGNKAEQEATARGIAQSKTFDVSQLGRKPPNITTLALKRNDDEDATRKIVDSSLVNSMANKVMTGKAAIDIEVGSSKQASAGDSDQGLFNPTRSKSAAQMPNTVSNTKDDKSSASSEEE